MRRALYALASAMAVAAGLVSVAPAPAHAAPSGYSPAARSGNTERPAPVASASAQPVIGSQWRRKPPRLACPHFLSVPNLDRKRSHKSRW